MSEEYIPPPTRLYLITPPVFEPEAFTNTLEAALGAGDVSALQLRLNSSDHDEIKRVADVIRPVVDNMGIIFILNNNPELAKEMGCDGVHIGQKDIHFKKAREIMGEDAVIGVTCHDSRDWAIEAADKIADYVSFGSFFPSSTVEISALAPIELLEWWNDISIVPGVACGGITIENCDSLIETGIDHLAVCSGVWNHPQGPVAAIEGFNRKLAKFMVK